MTAKNDSLTAQNALDQTGPAGASTPQSGPNHNGSVEDHVMADSQVTPHAGARQDFTPTPSRADLAPISDDALRELLAKATPGPWSASLDRSGFAVVSSDGLTVGAAHKRGRSEKVSEVLANQGLFALAPQLAGEVLARRGLVAPDTRSFPDAADGRPLPPMADELMTAGLSGEDACFVARQLSHNGLILTDAAAPSAPTELAITALSAVIKQGDFAYDPVVKRCTYYDSYTHNRCAVGLLVTKEEAMELVAQKIGSARYLPGNILPKTNRFLLREIQRIHDDAAFHQGPTVTVTDAILNQIKNRTAKLTAVGIDVPQLIEALK